jgi:hypothetical protein
MRALDTAKKPRFVVTVVALMLSGCSLLDLPEPGDGTHGSGGNEPVPCVRAEDCPGVDTTCAQRVCVNAVCETSYAEAGTVCSEDGGQECDATGSCVLFADGRECTDDNQCASAQCVDGVCCEAACSGACESCNLAESPGTCSPVPVGVDPDDECDGQQVCGGASSCVGKVEWGVSAITENGLYPHKLAVTPNGDVIATGMYTDGYSILTIEPLGFTAPSPSSYSQSVFITKIAASGTATGSWLKVFMGGGNEHNISAYGLGVDASGDIYVGGHIGDGSIDMNDGNGQQWPTPGYVGGFIAKLDGDTGNTIWSKLIASQSGVYVQGLAVAPDGSVAVTGHFSGLTDFGAGNVASASGSDDAYVAVYEPDGELRWVEHYGDANQQAGTNVAVLTGGEVAFVGTFTGTMNFGNGGGTLNTASMNGFVAVLNAQGTAQWSAMPGGDPNYYGLVTIAAAGDGDVVFGGGFSGTMTFGGETLTSDPSRSSFVTKYSPLGDKRWLRRFGDGLLQLDPAINGARQYIAADDRDVIFVVGATGPSIDFGIGPIGNQAADDVDLFVVRLEAETGNTVLNYHYTGASNERASGVALGTGAIFVAGTHHGTSLDGVSLSASGAGLADVGFVAKISN